MDLRELGEIGVIENFLTTALSILAGQRLRYSCVWESWSNSLLSHMSKNDCFLSIDKLGGETSLWETILSFVNSTCSLVASDFLIPLRATLIQNYSGF